MLNQNAEGYSFYYDKKAERIKYKQDGDKTGGSETFTDLVINAIDQEQTVQYNLKSDPGNNVIFDSYKTGDVSISDLKLLDGESDIQTAIIAQFITERHETENYEANKENIMLRNSNTGEFDKLHAKGETNRTKILSDLNGGVDMSVTDSRFVGKAITYGAGIIRMVMETMGNSRAGTNKLKKVSVARAGKINTYEKK